MSIIENAITTYEENSSSIEEPDDAYDAATGRTVATVQSRRDETTQIPPG